MLAVRIAWSDPDKAAVRQQHIEAHKLHLRSTSLRILLSGPLSGNPAGALIVAEVDALHDLERFSAADPFVLHGVYASVQIMAWNVTLSSLTEVTP